MALQQIDKENFNREIMDTERPSVLLFTSSTCHYCVALSPVYKELADKYSEHFSFYEVSYPENLELVELLEVDGAPSIFIFTDEPYGEGESRSRNVVEIPFPEITPPETGYEPGTIEEYLDYCAPLFEEEQNG